MLARSSLLFGACVMLACSGLRYGISEADLTKSRAATPRGVALFAERCASCHGQRGEGRSSVPPVLGPDALPEYPREQNPNSGLAAGDPEALRLKARSRPAGAPARDPFRTAADLHGYLSRNMPPDDEARAAITPDDYWALVNLVWLSRGASPPSEGITDKNAASVKF
jgi:mono/diheme cytochrome c family protein